MTEPTTVGIFTGDPKSLEIPYLGTAKEVATLAEQQGITTEEEAATAADIRTKLNKHIKAIEAARKEITDPINEQAKAVKAYFDEAVSGLKNALEKLDAQVLAWNRELQRRRQEEARREAEREAELERQRQAAYHEQSGSQSAPPPPPPPPAASAAPPVGVPKTVHGNQGGKATVATRLKFKEVADITKVPLRFLMVNEQAVNAAIRQEKLKEIPGLVLEEAMSVRG